MKDQLDVTCYFISLIMCFLSSGACDCVDELPHQSSCSQFRCVLELLVRLVFGGVRFAGFSLQNEHHKMDILMSETC